MLALWEKMSWIAPRKWDQWRLVVGEGRTSLSLVPVLSGVMGEAMDDDDGVGLDCGLGWVNWGTGLWDLGFGKGDRYGEGEL